VARVLESTLAREGASAALLVLLALVLARPAGASEIDAGFVVNPHHDTEDAPPMTAEEETALLWEQRSLLRVLTTWGWVATGAGLGLLGADLIGESLGIHLRPMGAIGAAWFCALVTLSTHKSSDYVKELPDRFRSRPARKAATVLFMVGGGTALAGVFVGFCVGLVYFNPHDPASVDFALPVGLLATGGALLLASSIVGHRDNERLIAEIDADLGEQARAPRRRPRPTAAILPIALRRGGGVLLVGTW